MHGPGRLYYLGSYLDCGSPIMPGPPAGKVHELILFRCKPRAMAPGTTITLGMGLSKPLVVILCGFPPGY